MAPILTQPAATTGKLVHVITLDGEQPANDKVDKNQIIRPISYCPNGKQIVGGSVNDWPRRWDLQTGREIREVRFACEEEIWVVAVSRDSQWVITGGGNCGELKAFEIETGMIKTFEGHFSQVTSIDVSVDDKLLASGSFDHTARIWDLNTSKLVAGPFVCAGIVGAVRLSQNSKKLAVKSGHRGRCLEVWDIQEQKLDGRVGESRGGIRPDSPVFWTTKDRSIVAAFSLEDDSDDPTKIYEFDSSTSTLETVGVPFEGHIDEIRSLSLSFDCALIASASNDKTIKLWAFESRQLLASFDVHNPSSLVLSPNSQQLAYASYYPFKIHICDIPPDILARIWPEQPTSNIITPQRSHPTDPLNRHPTRRPATVRPIPVSWSPAPRPLRSSRQERPTFLRQLRKLLPSYFGSSQITPIQSDEPRDPLDFPATSRLPFLSAEAITRVRPGANQDEHYPHAVTQSVPQNLSFSRPRTSHEPAIVEVAAGRKFTRLAVVNLPQYRKVNDTRRSSPGVSQPTAENDPPHDSSDNDSLPDVHWCKAFLCYASCWSRGALRMPPRWQLEHVDESQNGTNCAAGKADACG